MLVKRNCYTPAYNWNHVFGKDLFGNFWDEEEKITMPSANIEEEDKHFMIEVAAPGYKKEDFRVELTEENVLSISAEQRKDEQSGKKEKHFTRKEHSYAAFERRFTLPDNVDVEHIDAKYEDGLLKVTLPKKQEEARLSRQITVC
ncbi:MAG: Hsp20/alpha crystallin family protein [Bacteroidales bacterium]|nr:Hsp20/alpha crystallin family protein [Bacteroidales bacterium]